MANTVFSPMLSEFENAEQEKDYLAWLKKKVEAGLERQQPAVAHDAVMAEADQLILAIAREKGEQG